MDNDSAVLELQHENGQHHGLEASQETVVKSELLV
jgi:hypothetical protein